MGNAGRSFYSGSFEELSSYSGSEANDGGDLGPGPDALRRFGQLPGLAISDDFDQPLPESEVAVWETCGEDFERRGVRREELDG